MRTAYLLSNFDRTGAIVLPELTGKTALIIGTAALGENRPIDQEDVKQAYAEQGISARVVDILDMSPADLDLTLDYTDIVHFAGGNTFFLLNAIRKTRLDNKLANYPDMIYVGESAGAIILGKDIAHVAAIDDPSAAPTLASTKALGLCDDLVVPHYKGEDWGFGDAIDAWLEKDENRDDYTLIHEDGVLVVTQLSHENDVARIWLGTEAQAEWR